MTTNDFSGATPTRRAAFGGGAHWFADIICHLRDDLAADNPRQPLPHNGDIQVWVEEIYYPGLLELTWEEAVLSLLSRMQRAGPRRQPRKTDFAEIAMAQLRRATHNSQIWRV